MGCTEREQSSEETVCCESLMRYGDPSNPRMTQTIVTDHGNIVTCIASGS